MSDEPSLPQLPAVSWDERSQSFSNQPRKRSRSTRDGTQWQNNSSDPAVFSSDDDPGLDNYVSGRRKKRYVGSWFQQQQLVSEDSTYSEEAAPEQSAQPKRTLARQLDSGVFMGSDGTEDDELLDDLHSTPKARLPTLEQRHIQRPIVSEPEMALREKIRNCIEEGDEDIVFSSMGLTDIANETIAPLAQFTCVPLVAKYVAFEEKEPELKLNLSSNLLTYVPGSVFDLDRLTMLSVRGNQLSELPPAISKLRNLVELNVAQNQLRFLPVELLDICGTDGKLESLTLYPNPFLQPHRKPGTDIKRFVPPRRELQRDRGAANHERLMSRKLGRSPVQLQTSQRKVVSSFRIPSRPSEAPTQGVEFLDPSGDVAYEEGEAATRGSHASSLFELALRSCYRSDELPVAQQYLPEDLSHLRPHVEHAARQRAAGGLSCYMCEDEMVVPPLEWLEWRQLVLVQEASGPWLGPGMVGHKIVDHSHMEEEFAVPFLYRACSWGCGPRVSVDALGCEAWRKGARQIRWREEGSLPGSWADSVSRRRCG